MAKRTTVKAVALGYRDVGSSGDYTPLMGVLKGLAVAQDEPDSTEIEAEFYDSPFDIFYDGNPVTMTFELANYDLEELEDLFGGAYDDTNDEYEAASNAFTSEHEWKLDFGRGNASLVIYKGLTIGTLKKDADGALNYAVTITALIYNDGENDHMYKIVGSGGDTPTPPPVQGDVQIFVDEECSAYPTIGETYTELYARINVPWDMDGGWSISGVFEAFAPTTEYPEDPYGIGFLGDFEAEERDTPYEIGNVVVINATGPGTIPEGTSFVFTKPD